MKRRAWATGAFVVAASSALVISITTSAHASTPDMSTTKLGDRQFYTDSQIDSAWRAVVSGYPQPLAPSDHFSTNAPAFFHPNDGKVHLWEVGLAQSIAADYWRCSWLHRSLTLQNSNTTTSLDGARAEASEVLAAHDELALYASLPEESKATALTHDTAVKQWAFDQHKSLDQADYDTDCSIYSDH